MTAFIIEPKKMKGCTARAIETKLGLQCAPTGEFVFEGMKVPKENVLGKPGEGFRICMWQLNQTRLGCAAGALGVAGGALDIAINYANERTQFGKPISQHQMIQAQIAEMVVEHQAAQMLVYRAAWLKDQGKPNQYETSVAKLGGIGGRGARRQRVHEDLRLATDSRPSIRRSVSTATPSRCRSSKAPPTSRRSSSRAWPAALRPTANDAR